MFSRVHAVAVEESVGSGHSGEIDHNVGFSPLSFVDQRGNLNRRCAVTHAVFPQLVNRPAGIDNVFDK